MSTVKISDDGRDLTVEYSFNDEHRRVLGIIKEFLESEAVRLQCSPLDVLANLTETNITALHFLVDVIKKTS